MRTKLFTFLLAALALTACDSNGNPDDFSSKKIADINLSQDESKVASAQNEFAFEFLKDNMKDADNCIFSPMSLYTTFGMIANGAGSTTLEEIESVLLLSKYGTGSSELNQFCKKMKDGLNSSGKETQLRLAASLWINKDIPLNGNYRSGLSGYYGSTANAFKQGDESVIDDINSWAKRNTNGEIASFLTPQDFSSEIQFYALSTLYLKVKWEKDFNPNVTRGGVFSNADGSRTTVNMMSNNLAEVTYSETENWTVVNMPTKGPVTVMFALPNNKSLQEMMDSEDGVKELRDITAGFNNFRKSVVDLKMPKITLRYREYLEEYLKEIGMEESFSNDADFSGMTESQLKLSKVIQENVVSFDEEGAKAVSATADNGMDGLGQARFSFYLNRPYIFVFADTRTGAILFAGAVNKL